MVCFSENVIRYYLLYNYVVMWLSRYVTISVPDDVKRLLEKAKGREDWGSFLLRLYFEARSLKGMRAFDELTSILTEEDLKAIVESSREFRERFRFR